MQTPELAHLLNVIKHVAFLLLQEKDKLKKKLTRSCPATDIGSGRVRPDLAAPCWTELDVAAATKTAP